MATKKKPTKEQVLKARAAADRAAAERIYGKGAKKTARKVK